MSRSENHQESDSRAAKRARFASQKSSGASPLVLIAGLIIALAIIGGVAVALNRTAPTGTASVASLPSAGLEDYQIASPAQSPSAATQGHEPYPLVEAEDGTVRLPLATFDDYQAHHYTYMHDGRPIEFFALMSRDGTVRAAFNACDVCFESRKGYTQDGDYMVCNNCGRRFPADQINVVRGGCNPSPLDRTVEGDNLVIQAQDIVRGQQYF